MGESEGQEESGASECESESERSSPAPAGVAPPALVAEPVDKVEGGERPDEPEANPTGPGIASIKPAKAAATGGTRVTVFGAGFEAGCRVFVDNVAVGAEFGDAFCVRFDAPSHPVGAAAVEVENPDGSCSRSGIALAYEVGPVILDVHPFDVPIDGGIEIVVEGSDFDDGCAISLFGVHAPKLTRASSSELRFIAPHAGEGPYEGALVVTNPDGLSCRIEHALSYRALTPCIDLVEPASGWTNGGKAIEVRGADFHKLVRVSIGGHAAEVRRKSATLLEVVTPAAHAPGVVDLVVENPGGANAVLAGGFVFEPVPAPPKIISIVPDRGSTAGGLIVRVAGDNFTRATKIRVGEVTAVGRFVSPKIIEIELPPRSLPGRVAVEAADGGIAIRAEDAFTYFSPKAPRITGVEPASGPTTGGTSIVIEGEGFLPSATVRLGGESPKRVAVKNATRIEIVSPPARSAAFVDVEVSSPETGPGVMKNGFRYEAIAPPTIASVAPNRGGIDGGTELTVEGKNFSEGVGVTVGKRPAKRVKRISGSILEVITPDGEDGQMADVVVKNADGKEAVAKRAFVYDARYRG